MRKIRILGVAVFAVFAFAALTASSYGAVSQILVSGAKLTSGELLVYVKGELLLEDMGSAALTSQVLCSGWFNVDLVGEAGGAVLGFILGILTLAGVETSSINCTGEKTCEGTSNTVTPVHLPWHVEIELMTAGAEEWLLVFLLTNEAGEPGYTVNCNTIIGLVEDTCTGETSSVLSTLTSSTLKAEFTATQTPGNCTVGGTAEGLIEGSGEVVEPNGLPLALSSE